jgi:fatty-acyl-CoA synthase
MIPTAVRNTVSTSSAALDSLSYEPLTPTAYLDRAAAAHGDRVGVIDSDRRWTYTQLHERCTLLAGGLAPLAEGRPVAVLAPNTHVLLEANFGVPWAGVPLVAMNTRLSAGEVAHLLEHSKASVLIHDPSFDELVDVVFEQLDSPPHRIRAGKQYEQLLTEAQPLHRVPTDERSLLSINYTSGTTGRPKGVMYHHRGAYLQALAMVGHTGADTLVGAPMDIADVPLQRLVLPVGRHRRRRDPRLPAEGRPAAGVAADP